MPDQRGSGVLLVAERRFFGGWAEAVWRFCGDEATRRGERVGVGGMR